MTASLGGVLPDSLRSGLKVVFVGTAAGHRSAAVGAYYAHPGNRFWRTLHETGLTNRLWQLPEFRALLDHGIGFTEVAKHASGMDHEIAKTSFDTAALLSKLAHFAPRIVAYTSKRAASLVLRRPTRRIEIGPQPTDLVPGTQTFVLPSPSGAAGRHWSIDPWHHLAAAIRANSAPPRSAAT